MALYGHEISDSINVFEANLGRYCKLDKGTDFVGREALLKVQEAGGPARKLVGLEMVERGIGRDGYPVFSLEGEKIGEVTSGSPAPFLKKNIALAYVPVAYAEVGTEVAVEIRGQMVKAVVVPTPFYKRAKAGVAAPVITAPLLESRGGGKRTANQFYIGRCGGIEEREWLIQKVPLREEA